VGLPKRMESTAACATETRHESQSTGRT
jgi:hypothetical protein